MAEYKIGQILTSKVDTEIELALSGEKIKNPKGNKIIIGADKFAHHIRDGRVQPLKKDSIVEGYDTTGIAEYLYIVLRNHFQIKEMMEDYEISKKDFVDEIECALDEIL